MTYGCHNRAPFVASTKMQDGWYDKGDMGKLTRAPDLRHVKFRMEPTCQFTHTELGQADKRCTGCAWRKS